MKKLILIGLAISVGLMACNKERILPSAVDENQNENPDGNGGDGGSDNDNGSGDEEQNIYVGDSVRYSLDSLPVEMPVAPMDYSDYYKRVQVFSNNTVVIDFTHVFDNGMSVTYRAFVRYKDGEVDDFKGWYRRRKVDGFVVPNHKEVAIYRSVPYDIPENPAESEDEAFPEAP